MLNGITWMQFLEGTALLSVVYYAVVGLLYYGQDIKTFFQNQPTPVGKEMAAENAHDAADPLMPQIYELMTDIKELLQRAGAAQYVNKETIFGLQQLLKDYPAVKASRFVPAINNEINQLAGELLGQPFPADDLKAIWN